MIEVISSPHNKMVRMAAMLKQKKHRDELGCFLVEGPRMLEEAVKSDWDIDFCLCSTEAVENNRIQRFLYGLPSQIRVIQVSEELFKKVSDTEEPQGILAVVKKKNTSIREIVNSQEPFVVILDEIQDPGNVGAIIRTAAAAGSTGVLLTKGCADAFGTKTVRATMGSLFHLPVIQGLSKQEIILILAEQNIDMYVTSLEASKLYYGLDFTRRMAMVFGNEGNGVSQELLNAAKERIHIPLLRNVESLNVAASAAVILYEVVRQRG